ncbi:Glyoxylate/hydroxypyruvate reductase B [compost metagenome]
MTDNLCIGVSRQLPPPLLERLRAVGAVRMPDMDAPADLAELFKDADYALVTPLDGQIDRAVLAACPKLKLISTISAGYDHIDIQACAARGIVVCNTPGAVVAATADLAFGLMLAAARCIVEADAYVRAGRWGSGSAPIYGMDVHHKRMGIIGLGRIGAELAKRAKGFDMDVCYYNRRQLPPEEEARLGVRYLDLDSLLAQSDFVMVQAPYGPHTHHLIGAAQLARMKPSAVLVNAARGGVVDDAALAAALRERRIAAAGLDVTEGEPGVHPDLLPLSNLVLSPHIGSNTRETHLRMAMEAIDNLLGAIHGAPLRNRVTPMEAAANVAP